MSRNSYPSPVSSTVSPVLHDTAPATDDSNGQGQDHTDAQRSLLQASAALEAAYNRIRQVRRNLLELSDSLPAASPRTHSSESNNSIGPGHESITLTDAQEDDPANTGDDTMDVISRNIPSILARLRQYERILGLDRAARDVDGLPSGSARQLPPSGSLPSPLSPNRPQQFIQSENHPPRRRDIYSDDPTTIIGRRVAAREAAATTSSSSVRNSSRPVTVTMERDVEQPRRTTNQYQIEPYGPDTLFGNAARLHSLINSIASRRNIRLEDNEAASTTSSSSVRNRIEPNRSDTLFGSSAQLESLINSIASRRDSRLEHSEQRLAGGSVNAQSPISLNSERLSLLSNFSVQNLATPGSAITRPLLFDEPSSYTSPTNAGEEQRGSLGEERNYVIRRRMNADGEEHVHPISIDWHDDELSWMLPRRTQDDTLFNQTEPSRLPQAPSARYHLRSDTIQTSEALPRRPRRRGWARLDADGNEIPSDEEEELERLRAEYRVQAQSQPRPLVTAPIQGADVHPRLHSLHPPVTNTRTSLGTDEGSVFDADNPPRVHLNSYNARVSYGSVMDSVRTVGGSRKELYASRVSRQLYSSSVLPFCANPLPMPLDEMVAPSPKSTRNNRSSAIRVPSHPILAGR